MTEKGIIEQGTEILRPKARIISVIGSELISDDNVAIIELVKNSYDADSTSVDIVFQGPMLETNGKIIISDNGHGMSMDSVRHGWMEPATGEKTIHRVSPGGRRMLGEKGIGRFASSKIAKKLTLITREVNGKEIEAHFDWANFETSDKYLDEIKCDWEIREPRLIKEKGTILIMEPIRESWDEKKLRSLKLALSRLVNPWAPKKNFEIRIDADMTNGSLKAFSGEVQSPPSLGNPHYSVKGIIDSRGNCAMEYFSRRTSSRKSISSKFENRRMASVSCGPFSFEFRVWDRDDLESVAFDSGTTIREIRRDLNDASGVSVYRDGFRVLPYGESARKNDWLGLDFRRVQNPTLRLSNNQVVGLVDINLDTNPELKDQSNREGIVQTLEFEDFADKIIWILSRLEQERYQERTRVRATHQSGGIFSKIDLKPVVELIKKRLPEDKEANQLVLTAESQINEGIRKVKEVISRYHRLSTLGMLVDVVLHDGNDILVKLDNQVKIIEQEVHKTPIDVSKIDRRLELFFNERERLASLFRRLVPFGGRVRGPAKLIKLEDAIRDVFLLFQDELSKDEIDYRISTGTTEYKVDLAGFETMIVNLLQNSIYWIHSQTVRGGEIEVQVSQDDTWTTILFSDNGPGVQEQYQDLIFDPYFTTKPNGIGLGLTIAGEQATEYGGSFELLSHGPLNGATFQIKLPMVIS
jgi:signal transduction histidine kinase